ncbi:T9SS type A sorting domain-containing protein [Taibaiella soli]|uniref:Ig-like domain-containing protein n=1 Tax=Taibaiella soli TaxID=1649169 RepID=A0A2W2AVB9_9BACT|nr:T9SS type A sorting domain-containing protein [Taibaiella soli]PZF71894.1 hypothetical protein DN068_17725 [Taibaiella soli]
MKKLLLMSLAAFGTLCTPGTVQGQTITTFAGGIAAATGTGTNIGMGGPIGIARDAAGNIYVSDYTDNVVRKLTATGVATVIAGTGIPGAAGDNGPATAAQLNHPWGLAVDASGNVFIADNGNDLIRRVDAVTGIITRYAGWGPGNGNSQGGGTATNVDLTSPRGVAVDALGNLYISEYGGNRICKVTASNHILTVMVGNEYGTGGFSGDGGQADTAMIKNPEMLLLDTAGNLYFGEWNNHRIRVINLASGIINTFAGNGTSGSAGDSGLATAAQLTSPSGLARDANNNIYVCDYATRKIRKIDAGTGIITTVAGNGLMTAPGSGDGGPALSAQLNDPRGITADAAGNLYISDNGSNRVRMVNATTGIITNVMGNGSTTYGGDGDPANNSVLNTYSPSAVNVDAAGNVYISDAYRLRKVDAATNIISTIAGNGIQGSSGDGGPATAAQFSNIVGTATDTYGNVYIADASDYKIRKIDTAGTVTTFAGTGVSGYSGDGGPAVNAKLSGLSGLAMSPDKSILYLTDGSTIRQIMLNTGIINTIAGISGSSGTTGDGGLATAATLYTPKNLATDTAGNIYIVDMYDNRIRKITITTGIITTFAGGSQGFQGDGGPSTAAKFHYPTDIAFDINGNMYIVDEDNYRIRRIDAVTGNISTISGTGNNAYPVDGGPAISASYWSPNCIAVDAAGHLYVGDFGVRRVRTFTVPLAPSVRISASINNLCAGTTVNYTATPVVGGTNPSYQWIVNGTNVPGATSATYSYVPANGDSVRCKLISSASNATPATVISNTIGMTTVSSATPAINITASQNNICSGSAVTLTAVPTAGGTTPAYQWKINGNVIPGATDATYNYQPANNDTVKCFLTSNATCVTVSTAVSNDVTMAVNPIVTPTVIIAPSQNSVCIGAPVTYTATATNGGTTPSYKWSVNGTIVAGATDSTYAYTPANNDTIQCIVISNASCLSTDTAKSSKSAMTVNQTVFATVNITASTNNSCTGTQITFTPTATNGGTTPVYQWFVNGTLISGATDTTYSYTPVNHDTVKCTLISNANCADTVPVMSNEVLMTVNPITIPHIGIAIPATAICAGTTATYHAVPSDQGSNPTYQWYVNGNAVPGATDTVYSYTPLNHDSVKCVMTCMETCYSPTPVSSNQYIMTVNPLITPVVNVTPSQNNICTGAQVTYTAVQTNGGAIPAYQWTVNGNAVSGATNATYNYVPANNDTVRCILYSDNISCPNPAIVTSNDAIMTVNPMVTPDVSIMPSLNNICAGTSVTFTATAANAGTIPIYQWLINGTIVSSTNIATYSYMPADNDTVACILTSNANCTTTTTVTSNDTAMIVNPKVSPSVTISSSVSTDQITFSTTLTNGGANPHYQWRKNGTNITGATAATYFALIGTDVLNNDKISIWVENTDICGDTAVSGEMIITVVTGINEIGNSRYPLSLYPNPNSGNFTIKGLLPDKSMHEVKLEVYNTIGQIMHRETFSVTNGILEHSTALSKQLPPGNYFLKLNDGNSAVIRFTVVGN